MQHLAHHDTLTGLPNRVLFAIELKRALARTSRGEKAALLYLDLDHFKRVNDTLGHSRGDELLRQAADRLRHCVRDTDVIARLGGDEFAVVQTLLCRPADAAALATRMKEALKPPFLLGNQEVAVAVSIGIAIAPEDAADPEQLLKNADLALYAAKAGGRGAYHFYEEALDARLKVRHQVEADLRLALAEEQFELYYQPIVDLKSGEVTCCEALLRWHHPVRGMVSPLEFIPVAEECGLIGALGQWALRQACMAAASWPYGISVAVNLSSSQVRPDTLVLQVAAALAASGLAPDRLELEVTESVLMQDTSDTLVTLHHLRQLGVRIAMDDFGTGYSSLSYLRTFPFDKIKIDKSFIDHISDKDDCVAIVQAVTMMAQRLSMTTVAEGVETDAQRLKLTELGCTEMQGYLISRPRPAKELMRLLQERTGAMSAA
nr:EAL domain-containing protein [Bradyrhizobium sp. 147]